jgi:hypothetical protein
MQFENRVLKCGNGKMIINYCVIRNNNISKMKVYQGVNSTFFFFFFPTELSEIPIPI